MARPPRFDRSEVLEKATLLFWERGYRGVSISDLVEATGLLPGSLYGSFGNKEGMFLACLEHYNAQADGIRAGFENADSPLSVVRNFYFAMSEQSAASDERRGCFLVNASLECEESETAIKSQVRSCLDRNEAWLRDQLDAALRVGELRENTNTDQLAACLMGSVFGLRVMSRAQDESDKIRSVAEATFDSLISPWQQVAA